MAKAKSLFVCNHCGYESSGWLGKCPSCQSWNSFVEEKIVAKNSSAKPSLAGSWLKEDSLVPLAEVETKEENRFSSGLKELDRVLGGGFVIGSLVLVGGDPGIGKSTLLLQVSHLAKAQGQVLYISGEESASQIRLRANRLEIETNHITLCTQTAFEEVAEIIQKNRPALCIVDSIQTLYSSEITSAPGSVSQVREVTAGLLRLAKGLKITIVLVGHVTKDGSLAGPRVLEHMVDSVMYFEGENSSPFRLLRAVKNRFGATGELAFFEMTGQGLAQVENASSLLLAGRPIDVSGSVVTASMEGTRPFLIEIQALLSPTAYSVPQRMTQGLDRGRLGMILAVLEKKFALGLFNMDTYVNVVGGLRINETACDLPVAVAVFSALKDRALPPDTLVLGELGLTGEIRPVSDVERRVLEAGRLGFTACLLPGSNKGTFERLQKSHVQESKSKKTSKLPELIYADTLSEAIDILF